MTHPALRVYHRKDGHVEGWFIKGYDAVGKLLYGAVYGKNEDEVKFKYNILVSAHYTPNCMQERNKYMVDHSNYVIAVWNGATCGTGSTVRYAQSKVSTVLCIDPATVNVKKL